MKNSVLLILVVITLVACAAESKTSVIKVPTTSASEQVHVTRDVLWHIDPSTTSLEELYKLIGHPITTRALTTTIALRYPSEFADLPHIIVVDAMTGKIMAISIYNHDNAFFSLEQLKA